MNEYNKPDKKGKEEVEEPKVRCELEYSICSEQSCSFGYTVSPNFESDGF